MACISWSLFIAFTSQIHKYAHMEHPPAIAAFLQRMRLILTKEHHSLHHSPPYDRAYCITVGWMNGPLRAIRFFETSEKIITAITGWLPREDDIGKEAAIALETARQLQEAQEAEGRCEGRRERVREERDLSGHPRQVVPIRCPRQAFARDQPSMAVMLSRR